MNEVSFLFGLVAGALFAYLFVGVGPQMEAVESCRKANNVYSCEYVQEARPVLPGRPDR